MRILVTGSGGFIGKAVAAEIERQGHTMLPYDKPNDVRYFSAADVHKADAIINLAGMLGTPELFGSEAAAAEVNILGAIRVYDIARFAGIPVVQIGTGHKGQPNPYAITKGCAEDIGICRARYMNQKIAVVRAYHVYGPGQAVGPPHGRASVHKFFPTFACRALTGMPLELCGGGLQVIDPVYVDDCAQVLVKAVGGPYGEVIEAGTGAGITVLKVATDIGATARPSYKQEPPQYVSAEQRDGEPLDATVVASKPQCKNVWPYKVNETVDWYRQWLTDHSSQL